MAGAIAGCRGGRIELGGDAGSVRYSTPFGLALPQVEYDE
jgi:hypothetical protein